ncbi:MULTISPECIES: hypothetical protein [unclassified Roseovarius]|uniref:hypothetical protein n=1 Tax=unclassified Roseovarius TaxID=2614913 RepID=UPI00273DB293|nr:MULTISPECIES: hypothetical protein [unclassified Roseovarius]
MHHRQLPNSFSRRAALGAVAATILSGLVGTPALARGGGGGEANQNTNSSGSSSKKPKAKKTLDKSKPILITQSKFRRLTKKGLRTLISQIDAGQEARVQGFSPRFSRLLFETALNNDMLFVDILIGDLAKKNTVKERKEALRGWKKYVEDISERDIKRLDLPRNLEDILFDSDGRNQQRAAKIERRKRRKKLLNKWIWSPREGMLTS